MCWKGMSMYLVIFSSLRRDRSARRHLLGIEIERPDPSGPCTVTSSRNRRPSRAADPDYAVVDGVLRDEVDLLDAISRQGGGFRDDGLDRAGSAASTHERMAQNAQFRLQPSAI